MIPAPPNCYVQSWQSAGVKPPIEIANAGNGPDPSKPWCIRVAMTMNGSFMF